MVVPEMEARTAGNYVASTAWRSELSLGERLLRLALMLSFLGILAIEAYLIWQVVLLTA